MRALRLGGMDFEGDSVGDVVYFGPSGAAPRAARSWAPTLTIGTPLWLGIAGETLGAVSLFAPWQKLAPGSPNVAEGAIGVPTTIDRVGGFAFIYLIGLLGIFTIGGVVHFGSRRARRVAAHAGLGLGLALLLMTVALDYRLITATIYVGIQTSPVKYALDWGAYAGTGSVVAFGLSFLAVTPLWARKPIASLPEPDAVDLEVRVESA